MEKNKLDDLFRKKLSKSPFKATDDDWSTMVDHLQFAKTKALFWKRYRIGLLTGIVIITGLIFYQWKSSDLGYFHLPYKGVGMGMASNYDYQNSKDLSDEQVASAILSGQANTPTTSTKRMNKNKPGSVLDETPNRLKDDYFDNEDDIHSNFKKEDVIDLVIKDQQVPPVQLYFVEGIMPVGVIEQVLITPLKGEDAKLFPLLPATNPRLRQWKSIELLMGSTGQDHHLSSSLLFSIFRYQRLSIDVGIGVHYRQFDDKLIGMKSFDSYGFGQEEHQMEMYADRWLQLQVPLRLTYHLDRRNRLELTSSLTRHLNGLGFLESKWSEWHTARIGIIDDYFDLWSVSGQLHYTYDFSMIRVGGGVRVDHIMFNTQPEIEPRFRPFPISIELKIVKPF